MTIGSAAISAAKYPPRLSLAQLPTPIEFMPRLTRLFGGPNIYFKRDDLTGSTLSGNKIRKLEFSLAEARQLGAGVVITAGGIQSNHCRATAFACARLGLECHLVLRGARRGTPDGNLMLDCLAGARFTFLTNEVYSTSKPEVAARLTEDYARQGKTAYFIPVGASNAVGSWGYVRAFEEIVGQAQTAGLKVDHIVSATGSGGTTCGLVAGRAMMRLRKPQVWGINICDDAPAFVHDIRLIIGEMNEKYRLRMTPAQTPVNMIDGYVGEGYAIPYPEEMKLLAEAGRLEGQMLDPVYTAKALYGLSQEIKKGRFRKGENILFIHTGGMFGLFPLRTALMAALKTR